MGHHWEHSSRCISDTWDSSAKLPDVIIQELRLSVYHNLAPQQQGQVLSNTLSGNYILRV